VGGVEKSKFERDVPAVVTCKRAFGGLVREGAWRGGGQEKQKTGMHWWKQKGGGKKRNTVDNFEPKKTIWRKTKGRTSTKKESGGNGVEKTKNSEQVLQNQDQGPGNLGQE